MDKTSSAVLFFSLEKRTRDSMPVKLNRYKN
jgi:hypothetical protein